MNNTPAKHVIQTSVYLPTNTPAAIHHYKVSYNMRTQSGMQSLVHNGFVYIEVQKEMYGLKQTGVLANKNSEKVLNTGHYVKKNTPQSYGSTLPAL